MGLTKRSSGRGQAAPLSLSVMPLHTTFAMTTYEKWSLIISALGFFLVVLSMAVLIYQTWLLSRSINATANASVGDRQLEADKIFVEKPELAPYFFDNVEISPGHADYAAAWAVAHLLANFLDTYYLQKGQFDQMYTEQLWEAYINDRLRRSPILRRFLEENSTLYTSDIAKCVETLKNQNPA